MKTIQEIEDVKKIILARNIRFLVHFTRIENLPSILKHGLYPRSEINDSMLDPKHLLYSDKGVKHIINDEFRYDNKNQYNCLSINFPNYKMFYKYRRSNLNNSWVILILRPNILLEKDCLFYPTNAASHLVRNQDTQQFSTSIALENMFIKQERPSYLELCDPTDVQAEVMVDGIIEPHYISNCVFDNLALKEAYELLYPNTKMHIFSKMYSERSYARN